MPRTVALIHAVLPSLAPMREALTRDLPEVRAINILDEGLLTEVERYGGLAPACVERLTVQVGQAIAAGAEAVLLACTAYSPAVGAIQARYPDTPLIPVDQAMVDAAVARGRRIGVLATVRAGLEQQTALLRQTAERAGQTIEIVPSLHPAAFQALQAGDADAHDRLLLEALPALAAQVDLVLLAQASMARLVPRLPTDLSVPVLSSPHLAIARLRAALAARDASTASSNRHE